jgi:CRP-like cAMP-binding protein
MTRESEQEKKHLDTLVEGSRLFEALGRDDRRRLLDCGVVETFPKGHVVLREGDHGDCFYLLDQGEVEVATKGESEPLVLATLGPGAVFGEVPVFAAKPRTATVTALSDVLAVRFANRDLEALLEACPALRRELEDLVLGRARKTIEKLFARK